MVRLVRVRNNRRTQLSWELVALKKDGRSTISTLQFGLVRSEKEHSHLVIRSSLVAFSWHTQLRHGYAGHFAVWWWVKRNERAEETRKLFSESLVGKRKGWEYSQRRIEGKEEWPSGERNLAQGSSGEETLEWEWSYGRTGWRDGARSLKTQ